MVERQIVIEPLQKSFRIGMKRANKSARNRSFLNATNCCGVKVKQEKKCSQCNEVVNVADSQNKIVMIGKQAHLISAQALKDIQETLAQDDSIKVHTFLKEMPHGADDRIAGIEYGVPADKRDGEYAELTALLKNRVAIGTGVFGKNEFQVMLTATDGIVRIHKLIEERQRYDFDERQCAVDVQLNGEVIEIENKILDKHTTNNYDITSFRDSRAELEEQVIEDFIINGKVPEVKAQVQQKQDINELERLKALMG